MALIPEEDFVKSSQEPKSSRGVYPCMRMTSIGCSFISAAALTLLLFASPKADQDGLQLFHKMQNALGGAQRIASVRDFEQCVRAQAWDPRGTSRGTVHKRVRFIRPDQLRVDQVGTGATFVLYFDGKTGWEILPDRKMAELAGSELQFAQGWVGGLSLNAWLADRDPDAVFTSPAPNVIRIASRDDPRHGTETTLDPQTSLPSKTTGFTLDETGRTVSTEGRMSHWIEAGGVKFPGVIENYHDGKKLAEITVDQIKVNRGLKVADLAQKPADLNPVMCR
jgi:hypothetical protein